VAGTIVHGEVGGQLVAEQGVALLEQVDGERHVDGFLVTS
jgi:hypothetical protein